MNNFRTLAFLTCAALAFCATLSTPAHAQQDGLGIAAVVNDDAISILDLDSRIRMILHTSDMAGTQENYARVGPQVLRSLIDEKLMMQEARRVGLQVTQAEVDDGLAQIAGNNNFTPDQLKADFAQRGVPVAALTSRIEAELTWQLYVFRNVRTTIKVGEEEINDEIKRIQASAGKPEYLLAEIFLPVDTPAQDAEVAQLAQSLLQQMQAGAPFRALAGNFSRSPSAALGGDLGWVQPSHLDQELQNVVAQLRPGQVSTPVRTLGGYYLIMLREVRVSPGLNGGDATLKLSQLHMTAQNPNDMNALAQQLTSLARTAATCAEFDALAAQTGSPLSGPMGQVTLSAMPDNMRSALASLPVGQASAPIATGGGLAVMMVCERSDGETDMEEVRTNITERLIRERMEVAAMRRLRELRRDAFVDIRL